MPRYDERSGPTRLYVGHISRRTRSRDLEDIFGKYGRVRDVDMKHDFAFVDFGDSRDADDARHYLNGRTFDGSRIVVEFAKRGPRGDGGSRDYVGRGPAPGTGRCYNCGHDGHWARDCKAGDWKNKCYKCGQQGHIERNCNNSPRAKRSASRSRSRSRSPLKGRRRRSRSRSYSPRRSRYSRSPRKEALNSPSPDQKRRSESRSRSRSPKRTRSRNPSRSPRKRNYSHSPTQSPRQRTRSHSPPVNPPKRGHSQSPAPNDENPARSHSVSPVRSREERRDLSPTSPRNAWRSPNNNSERDDDVDRGAASRSASSSPQRENGLHQDYVSPQNGNSPSRSG